MKKITRTVLHLYMLIAVLTSLWLVAEVIHYKATGDYFLYYKLWLREANNAADEIYIINQVFNVRNGRWANVFSNYFLPIVMGLSIPVWMIDTLFVMDKREHILRYALYCAAVLVMLGIVFIG